MTPTANSESAETDAAAVSAFLTDGVSIFRSVTPRGTVHSIAMAFGSLHGKPGQRRFALSDEVRLLIGPDGSLGQLAARLAHREMRPVRIVVFDKTPESNWAVPWHQDRTIAVKERADAPGFDAWNIKDGVVHVEPPTPLLENMLTLRLFLDPCDLDNGPLEVACATHLFGRIPSAEAAVKAYQSRRFTAIGEAGDVLAMRLLSLHKSDRASRPSRRRVLHVDYAAQDPPKPLEWAVEV